jgi:hypothetical protein
LCAVVCGLVVAGRANIGSAASLQILSPANHQTVSHGQMLRVEWRVVGGWGRPLPDSDPLNVSIRSLDAPVTLRLPTTRVGGHSVQYRIPSRMRSGRYEVVLYHSPSGHRVSRNFSVGNGYNPDPQPDPRPLPPPPPQHTVDLTCRIANLRISHTSPSANAGCQVQFEIHGIVHSSGSPPPLRNVPCRWIISRSPLDGRWGTAILQSGTATLSSISSRTWSIRPVVANLASSGPGNYELSVTIDPDRRIRDDNRDNNTATRDWQRRQPTPPPQHTVDLTCRIENFRIFHPSPSADGCQVQFDIRGIVQSSGSPPPLRNVPCRWVISRSPLGGGAGTAILQSGTTTLSSISSGTWSAQPVVANLASSGPGNYQLTVVIDPDRRIRDNNRDNNVASKDWQRYQ